MSAELSGAPRKKECLLLGVGSPYVYEVVESLSRDGWAVRAYIDNLNRNNGPSELGEIRNLAETPAEWVVLPVFIPLLTPGYRKAIFAQACGAGWREFPSHVDPTAIIASSAQLGHGVLVNAAAVIGAKSRLGKSVIANRSASIGHDVVIEEYATLGPGCILCGSSVIGRGAFVGAGAVICPGVNIGANTIIGAGAVVTKDVGDRWVAVGNPARVVTEEGAGYNNVLV